MPPESYLLADPDDAYKCLLMIAPSNYSHILDDPFLRTFTTTYDYKGNKMEIGVNINEHSRAKIVLPSGPTSKPPYIMIFLMLS